MTDFSTARAVLMPHGHWVVEYDDAYDVRQFESQEDAEAYAARLRDVAAEWEPDVPEPA